MRLLKNIEKSRSKQAWGSSNYPIILRLWVVSYYLNVHFELFECWEITPFFKIRLENTIQ